MLNRRSLITNGSTAAFGAMALAAVAGGTAQAAPQTHLRKCFPTSHASS